MLFEERERGRTRKTGMLSSCGSIFQSINESEAG